MDKDEDEVWINVTVDLFIKLFGLRLPRLHLQ